MRRGPAGLSRRSRIQTGGLPPLLGWGLGTFPTIYPSFRSFYTNLFVNQAHNDYAQLLVETGLLGFGLMLWFVFRLYRYSYLTSLGIQVGRRRLARRFAGMHGVFG